MVRAAVEVYRAVYVYCTLFLHGDLKVNIKLNSVGGGGLPVLEFLYNYVCVLHIRKVHTCNQTPPQAPSVSSSEFSQRHALHCSSHLRNLSLHW